MPQPAAREYDRVYAQPAVPTVCAELMGRDSMPSRETTTGFRRRSVWGNLRFVKDTEKPLQMHKFGKEHLTGMWQGWLRRKEPPKTEGSRFRDSCSPEERS